MSYELEILKKAAKEIDNLGHGEQKKVVRILETIQEDPYSKQNMAEKLKHAEGDVRSMRVTKGDRVVYGIQEEPEQKVRVYSAKGHY